MNRVEVEGRGLFSGALCHVTLTTTDRDHVRIGAAGGHFIPVGELRVASTVRTTTVACGATELGLVEHLFAALAAFHIRAGLDIEVRGSELPLLDGGASAWCAALAELERTRRDVASHPNDSATLEIVECENIEVGESEYRFLPARGCRLQVNVDFGDPRLSRQAEWTSGREEFVDRIAPARTFLRLDDAEAMLAAGLAAEVEPTSVVVLTRDAIHAAGRPFEADEPARHKLLDLLGDLYLHGGPPSGAIEAYRPGHAATHRAIELALARGILRRQPK